MLPTTLRPFMARPIITRSSRPLGSAFFSSTPENPKHNEVQTDEKGDSNLKENEGKLSLSELVVRLAKQYKLKVPEANDIIESVLETIITGVAAGRTVQLPKLGSFRPVATTRRKWRNPKTGEDVIREPRVLIRLKPSLPYRQKLNPKDDEEK